MALLLRFRNPTLPFAFCSFVAGRRSGGAVTRALQGVERILRFGNGRRLALAEYGSAIHHGDGLRDCVIVTPRCFGSISPLRERGRRRTASARQVRS
jgi:hypothetical protein